MSPSDINLSIFVYSVPPMHLIPPSTPWTPLPSTAPASALADRRTIFIPADAKGQVGTQSLGYCPPARGSLLASGPNRVPARVYCRMSSVWELAVDPLPRLDLLLIR
jgi:hypothetical protein